MTGHAQPRPSTRRALAARALTALRCALAASALGALVPGALAQAPAGAAAPHVAGAPVATAVFEHRGVVLLLPPGYAAPAAVVSAGSELFTFRKPVAGTGRATTITVTLIPHRPGLALDAWDRREVQERQLRQHLETLAGRRGEFSAEPVRRIRLGDSFAASARWHGSQDGVVLAGAMTALARAPDLVLFSVQGFPDAAAGDLAEAIDAVERAVIADR